MFVTSVVARQRPPTLAPSLRRARRRTRPPTSAPRRASSGSTADDDEPAPPTPAGVAAARERFAASRSSVVETPLLESPLLDRELNLRLLVKAESLQRTGSFKFRGALNRLLTLGSDAARRGVVAFSSGNFGQALAAAAQSLDVPCRVVSPHDAPRIKLDRIRRFGAELALSRAGDGENREVVASALARKIAEEEGRTLLHPFEDAEVVHGQGTCGMELLDQALAQVGDYPDVIAVPCGGGGLTAGINLAVEHRGLRDRVRVYTVEPKGFDDHRRSFERGERASLAELYPEGDEGREKSLYCDALMAGAPGRVTWRINAPRLAGALESPGDDSAARAMRTAFDHHRLVLEPSGALALAAVLDGAVPLEEGATVVVVASGGNTDMGVFAKLMGCAGAEV